MEHQGARYYYSRLTDREKSAYDALCKGLDCFASSVSLGRISPTRMQSIVESVVYDNPGYFYFDQRRIAAMQTLSGITVKPEYCNTPGEVRLLWKQIQAQLDAFMHTRIRPGMPPLARQIEVHRWMQQHIRIADGADTREQHSAVGALVQGSCVCEGFAHAYKLLCDRLHLASILVTGTARRPDGVVEPHAWNITRLEGITAHIDVTWDTALGSGAYDYFNLTDAEIRADHCFDGGLYPPCTEKRFDYFTSNRLVAKDPAQLGRLIAAQAHKACFSVKLAFPWDAALLDTCGFPVGRIRYNQAQNVLFFQTDTP